MVSYARKYDVSENLNHYRLDGIRYKIRENMSTRKGHIGLDAREFSCAKISTFTVFKLLEILILFKFFHFYFLAKDGSLIIFFFFFF